MSQDEQNEAHANCQMRAYEAIPIGECGSARIRARNRFVNYCLVSEAFSPVPINDDG